MATIQSMPVDVPAADHRSMAAHEFSSSRRLLIVLLNYLPVTHVVLVMTVLAWPWAGLGCRLLCAAAVLFLLPPLLARALLLTRPFRSTTISLDSPDFLRWWALWNLQALFCRFPLLEEGLRIIPGFYSFWLRLWGARIGRLTYWAPGMLILDRSFLDIGDDVLFGAGVRLNPHVISPDEQGRMQLLLAPVKIGKGALIGGYALLTTGTEIPAGESTRAYLLSAPFSRWQNGKRIQGPRVD